jgi:hypothetical protein
MEYIEKAPMTLEAKTAREIMKSIYLNVTHNIGQRTILFHNIVGERVDERNLFVSCYDSGNIIYESGTILQGKDKEWVIAYGYRETKSPLYMLDSKIVLVPSVKTNMDENPKHYVVNTINQSGNWNVILKSLWNGVIMPATKEFEGAAKIALDYENPRTEHYRNFESLAEEKTLWGPFKPTTFDNRRINEGFSEKIAKAIEDHINPKHDELPF